MSYDKQRTKRWANLTYTKTEDLRGRVWAQLRGNDTPSTAVFTETQYSVSPCLNAVYTVEMGITDAYRLPLFNGASDMVDEENEKAGPALISVVLKIP